MYQLFDYSSKQKTLVTLSDFVSPDEILFLRDIKYEGWDDKNYSASWYIFGLSATEHQQIGGDIILYKHRRKKRNIKWEGKRNSTGHKRIWHI